MPYVEQIDELKFHGLLQLIQNRIMEKTSYFGIRTYKNPLDFWVYQEIIYNQKPDIIIEIGNCYGGSTLALAHLLDNMDHGKIIGIDISHLEIDHQVKNHPRITLIQGDACMVYEDIIKLINPDESVLIIEDSSHTYENTLNILNKYSSLIEKNGYFIIEDGICHHGVAVGPNPGPFEACETFVKGSDRFIIDREMESFCITWNPKGYLKAIS